MSLLSFNAHALTCTQTFTASGTDNAPTILTINASSITCNAGGTINSLTLTNAAGSLISGNCGTWFGFNLSVDGGAPISPCGAAFNGTDITGFTTLTITSFDWPTDGWGDNITITIDVLVDYNAPACAPPTAPSSIVTLPSTADLSWTAAAGASAYNVEYRQVGSPTWISFAGNPVLTNL